MIRFGLAALALKMLLAFSLTVEPQSYHVEFPPDPNNVAIVLVISSDTNQKPYYQWDEVPIEDELQSSVDIPRHSLPHGGYHIQAMLMKLVDGKETFVDSADVAIKVN